MTPRLELSAALFIVLSDLLKKRKSPRCWVRPYLTTRESSGGKVLLESLKIDKFSGFRNFTRISTEDFEFLATSIGPRIARKETNYRKCISVNERLAITLRYLATGDSYASISYNFKVSTSVISRTVPEVCIAIILVLEHYVKIPQSTQEWKKLEQGFNSIWNFPHCIGALDGKHVVIIAPDNTGSQFFNYKSTFSIVLLAIVDADYCFTYADIGCQGRISDGGVFKNSSFYVMLQNGALNIPTPDPLLDSELPYVLVADDAFALESNIMKPFPGHHEKGSKERVFNYRLSRARRISENAFGILSSIFRVLRKPISLNPKKATVVTLCCLFLHNFLRKSKKSTHMYTPVGSFDREDEITHEIREGTWRRDPETRSNLLSLRQYQGRPSESPKRIRDKFAEYFISEIGSVPWQYHMT